MSGNDAWKDELSEEELKRIAGGGDTDGIEARVYYRCETCGKTWETLLSNFRYVPDCCGKRMKLDHWHKL